MEYLLFLFQLSFVYNLSNFTLHVIKNSPTTFLSSVLVANKTSSFLTNENTSTKSRLKFSTPVIHSSVTFTPNLRSNQETAKAALRWGHVHAEGYDPNEYCKYQPNGFDCDDSGIFIPKPCFAFSNNSVPIPIVSLLKSLGVKDKEFYYDVQMETCKSYYFGGCKGDINKFDTLIGCSNTCSGPGNSFITGNFSAKSYCKFQPQFGHCSDYYPKFYYDISTRTCKGFAYSGCGGNLNRFDTDHVCMSFCGATSK